MGFTARLPCSGLQVIGSNQTETKTLGVPLHMTMAMTADGLPLGVLPVQLQEAGPGP